MNVRQELYDQGIKTVKDFAKLKGKKIGVGASGSINQYNTSRALQAAGLDPGKDVVWIIVDILAKNTALNKPELVKAIAPFWSYVSEDGIPQVDSILRMQDYWNDYYTFVERKVPREQLFDLSVAREAKARLDREKPFGR